MMLHRLSCSSGVMKLVILKFLSFLRRSIKQKSAMQLFTILVI